MFDQIAERYDLINGILSLGIHSRWRDQLIAYLPPKKGLHILDLATGTGDIPLILAKDPRVAKITGLDLSRNMIHRGIKKVAQRNLENKITLSHGDAVTIPLEDASVDIVTIGFGIRNVSRPETCLKNIHRVLRPGGRVLILEFSIPSNPIWKMLYLFWLRFPLPFIGAQLSRHPEAYRYLNKTIEDFPCGADFSHLMERAGFQSLKRREITFETVTLYSGEKT